MEHVKSGRPPARNCHDRKQELGNLDEELAKQRQDLPWVRVEKEYTFDTEQGEKTLVELFDRRSQLLIYHLMFGPTYEAACPGCTGLARPLRRCRRAPEQPRCDPDRHLPRAPIEKLQAYKQRMGWKFPYVSSFGSDFNFDFDFAFTQEQMATGELAKMVAEAPDLLDDWAKSVGTDLRHGMAESPGWNVFALEDASSTTRTRAPHPTASCSLPFTTNCSTRSPTGVTPTSPCAATTSTDAVDDAF